MHHCCPSLVTKVMRFREQIDQGQNRLNLAVYWVGSTASTNHIGCRLSSTVSMGNFESEKWSRHSGRQRWKVRLLLVIGNDCGRNCTQNRLRMHFLFTHPADGTGNHIKDHLNIESGLSLGLSVAIDAEGVQPEHIQVRRPNGEFHPVVIDVFYGPRLSHHQCRTT